MKRRRFCQLASSLPFLTPFRQVRADSNNKPKRFIVFHYPQGTVMKDFVPTGATDDFELSYILQPLEEMKQNLQIITGVDNVIPSYNQVSTAHPNANYTFLTGTPFLLQSEQLLSPAGPSIEQVIAERIGQQNPHQRIDLAIGGAQHSDGVLSSSESTYFWHGPNDPVACFNDPSTALSRIFGDSTLSPSEDWIIRSNRSTVLNGLLRQFDAFRPQMTAEDKLLLDAHSHKIEQLFHRISASRGTCETPQPLFPHQYNAAYDDQTTAPIMIDMLVEALSCDYSRVATIHFANSHDHAFEWLWERNQFEPIVNHQRWDNWHAMVHADYQPGMEHVFHWYMECFAYLLNRLANTVDSDGDNMLESSVVLCLSEFSSGRHWHSSLPVVFAGNESFGGKWHNYMAGSVAEWESAGGQLQSGYTMNQLLLSILHAFGFDDQTFGYVPSEQPTGPLEELFST